MFQTDPQKPLIGSLSRVVEHPHKLTFHLSFIKLILKGENSMEEF